MKAKVIATGETVEVVYKRYPRSGNLYYEDIETKKHYDADELKPLHKIDWEQRRFELIKSAMQGWIASEDDRQYKIQEVIDIIFPLANAVIKKLKEE